MTEFSINSQKRLYEHPMTEKIEEKITEIIMLEQSKTYSLVSREDVIGEIYTNLLNYLSRLNPNLVGSLQTLFKDKSGLILYVFNHPDFKDLSQGFLRYIDREVEITTRNHMNKFTNYHN